MADEEIAFLLQLREETVKRKREHELQRARQGDHTPADVVLAIKAAELEIERIDARLLLIQVSAENEAATGPEAGVEVVRHKVKQLDDAFRESAVFNRKQLEAVREEVQREAKATRDETRS